MAMRIKSKWRRAMTPRGRSPFASTSERVCLQPLLGDPVFKQQAAAGVGELGQARNVGVHVTEPRRPVGRWTERRFGQRSG